MAFVTAAVDAVVVTPGACSECGGCPVDDQACLEMFEAILAWEWQNPALGAVHFLAVSAYLLQHPASLKDDALNHVADRVG